MAFINELGQAVDARERERERERERDRDRERERERERERDGEEKYRSEKRTVDIEGRYIMSSANEHDKFLENTFIFQEHLRRGVKWVLIQKGGM